MTTVVRLTGLDEVVAKLEKMPMLLVGRNGGIARASLKKAAKLLETQAKSNLQKSIAAAGRTGLTVSTGFTAKQVKTKTTRRRLAEKIMGGKGEAVYVTVNYIKHPTSKGKFRNRTIAANDIAFLLENGAKNLDPLPWMRPAFAATADKMLLTIETEVVAGINKIWG